MHPRQAGQSFRIVIGRQGSTVQKVHHPPSTSRSAIQRLCIVTPSRSFSAFRFSFHHELRRPNAAEDGSACAHSICLSTVPEEEHVARPSANEETDHGYANTGTECAINTSMSNSTLGLCSGILTRTPVLPCITHLIRNGGSLQDPRC